MDLIDMDTQYNSIIQNEMVHEKTKAPPLCTMKTLIVAAMAVFFAILVTALVTWRLASTGFDFSRQPGEKPHDSPKIDEIPAEDLRLITATSPLDYELTIKAYLPGYGWQPDAQRNKTFEGQVTIRLNVTQVIKKIILNSLDLSYNKGKSSVFVGDREVKISNIEPVAKFEKVFVYLQESIEPSTNVILKLVFNGDLRTDMTGLYQTNYTTSDGKSRMAAVTQFEPVYARRMVPCYDEPAFKAPWTVTVIHPKGTVAIANGKENRTEEIAEDFLSTSFKITPKMSSYLLAIFISEFEFNELSTKSGTRFRVWSRPEEKKSTDYAVKAGVKCLEYYEDYYGIKFPLEKQDMVALPDFAAGAMENWGLITYRENALLYDPKLYTLSQKQRVAVVIAHELAHQAHQSQVRSNDNNYVFQWFGNLVTMKWWNDLWLNEGFATLVEYLGTDKISDGKFRMNELFTINDLSSALEADSIATTHPMTFKIDKATEVEDAFDTITYSKGGAVLAMLRRTVGEENFNAAVNHYLKSHAYDNAEASDLFAALQEKLPSSVLGPDANTLNISEFAAPWTKQLGYPMLSVTRLNDSHVTVSQQRFKKLQNAKEPEKYSNPEWGFKWDVPVWYQEEGGEIRATWMKRDSQLIIASRNESTIVLNADSNGLYRVNYEESHWNRIIDNLKANHEQYSSKTRVRLIEDAFMAAFTARIDYSIPIRMMEYLRNEKDLIPWKAALSEIHAIISMYGTDPEKVPIEKFALKVGKESPAVKPMHYVEKNYQAEEQFFELLVAQTLILNDCTMQDAECSAKMAKLFHDFTVSKCHSQKMTSECSQVPPPFRVAAYCHGVKNGDATIFETVFEWYKNEMNQVERNGLMAALTCTKDVTTLKQMMLDAMKPEGSSFRLQDVGTLFRNIAGNSVAKDGLLNFLLSRWDDLQVRLATSRSVFVSVIKSLVSGIGSKEGLQQLEMWREKTESAKEYDFEQIEEPIRLVIEWREKNMKSVSKLFEQSLKNV